MVYVGSSWVELDYWTSPSWGSYDARLRVLAYSTQDIASNTSRIYFKLQKRVTGGSAYQYDPLDFQITGSGAKGDSHSATQTWTFGSVSDTSWVDVGGDTSDMYWSNVKHNDDGTLTLTANAEGDRILGGSFDTDITIQLPTIARASKPTITPNPQTWSNTTSNTITVNTNRKSSSFTHTVRCDLWGFQQTNTGVGASTTFDIPYSTLASMPDTYKSFTGSVYTKTYSGATQIGSEVRSTWTVKIDTAIEHAVIGTITIQDTNARTSAVTQDNSVYIANISTLEATIPLTVSGDYTELAQAVVTCGNKSQTYALSGTSQTITFEFDKVNASSLTVKVTDKRGNSVTATKSWTLIQYQPVTATATVGRPSATGSVGVGQVTGMAYGGNFGATQNSLTIVVDFKLHSAADYDPTGTETYTLALSQSGYNDYTDNFTFNYTLDYQYQYDVRFTVSDLFSTAVYTAQLMQGLPILSWDETEVDVWGNLHIHDRSNPTQWQDVIDGFDAVTAHNGKNLIPPTRNTVTASGITMTPQADGSLKFTGTATGMENFNINTNFTLPSGDYILSGMGNDWVNGTKVYVRRAGSTMDTVASAEANDVLFTYPDEPIFMYFHIESGTVLNDFVFKPMVRDARLLSDSFVPYRPSLFPDYAKKISQTTLTRNGTSSFTLLYDCHASISAHIQANSNGIIQITINNTQITLAQTNGSANYFYTRDFNLRAGDVISIRLDTNASDNYFYLYPYRN